MRTVTLFLLSLTIAVSGCLTDERDRDGGRTAAVNEPGEGEGEGGEGEGEGQQPSEGEGEGEIIACAEDTECSEGSLCNDGFCGDPECLVDDECERFGIVCHAGRCRQRCSTGIPCFGGGVCIDDVCVDPECEAASDCEDEKACEDGKCVAIDRCAEDDDCGPEEFCNGDRCQGLPTCGGDRNCNDDELCVDGRCRTTPLCAERDDCSENMDCVGGRCVPFVCRGDGDCEGDEICSGGECLVEDASGVTRVLVITRPRTAVPGQQVQYEAIALNARGDIVATRGFTWDTSDPDIAAIDEHTGLATAGQTPGTAQVRAGIAGSGDEVIWSDPIDLTVVAPAPGEGLRVRVADAATGAALAGATVRVGDASEQTGADGLATFAEAPAGAPLSVFHEDHDAVTIIGSERRDLLVPLPRRSNPTASAGFTGEIEFDRVTTQGGVELGLAGASLSGGLTNVDLGALVGEIFNTTVGAGGFSTEIPLPGGITLAAEIPVLGFQRVKDKYYVLAQPGFRLAWSFAGRLDIQELMGLFGGGGGGFDAGTALTTLLPHFEQFEHGLRSAPDVVLLPRVEDRDDLDGDGDREELIPDYDGFPVRNLKPERRQTLRLSVDVPDLPEAGEGTPAALLFAGVEVDGVGFVPLGVSSATQAERVHMRMTPPYGGLEAGEYTLLVLATQFEESLPNDFSGLIQRHGLLPRRQIALDSFLPIPTGADWDPVERTVVADPVDGASFHKAVFDGDRGRWTVWFASTGPVADGAPGDPTATLPFPPEGTGDLAAGARVRFEAVRLPEGMSLDDLLGDGGPGDILDVDRFAEAYSRKVIGGE